MRILPKRTDHAGGGNAQIEAEAYRSRHRRVHARQYLPLRNISANSPGDQARRGSEIMIEVVDLSRRSFLNRIFSAAAFVVAAPLRSAAQDGTAVASEKVW